MGWTLKIAIVQGKQENCTTIYIAHRILSHSPRKNLCGEETLAKARAYMYSRLYIVGDKYDIPQLRELTARKFLATIEKNWDKTTFIPLIRSVFEGTASENNNLREGIIKATLRHIHILEERQDFNQSIRRSSSFSYQLLQCMISNAARQKRYHYHRHTTSIQRIDMLSMI